MSDDWQELRDLLMEQRKVIREGHALVKDMTRLIDEARKYTGSEEIRHRIEHTVEEGLKEYNDIQIASIEKGTAAVYARFDMLAAFLLGEDDASVRRGERSMPDLIREYLRTTKLPYELVAVEQANQELQDVPPAFRKTPRLNEK
jgi:hypothetical protein